MSRPVERRFSGILKGRAKALSIFKKALDQIKVVQDQVSKAKALCEVNIVSHEKAIEEEVAAVSFLDLEATALATNAADLAKFVPGEEKVD